MAYPFTEDHDMIRDAAKGALDAWYDGGKGPERVAETGGGFDEVAWRSFAAEQGFAGIAIDEEYGGAGLGDLGRAVVMEELGASLCAVPFLATVNIAAEVINGVADTATKAKWLGKIARGDLISTFAYGNGLIDETGGYLSGKMDFVADASHADEILISRLAGAGVQIFSVAKGTNGLSVKQQQTMDPTRSYATVVLDGVALADVTIIGECDFPAFGGLFDSAHIALAAECVGGAQKCLDITLEYAAQRVQFDRPIASFQAYKHKCADMFIALEAAKSATYAAAIAPPEEKTEAAQIAKAVATDAYFDIAGDAIQLHGGIGFTWEYPVHFFFKRARANRTMFTSSSQSLDAIANMILGDAA